MIPTGGVNPEMAQEYLTAGAWAIGVGSELVSNDVLAVGGLMRLRSKAAAFVEATQMQ
jgi:2-dehydro-3-deoxyphosphogluconate aldolase/(4S)-4-hydroxy-2-oxoglutarate aldolase